MRKQGAPLAVVGTAVGLVSLLIATPPAFADHAAFPRLARSYSSWLVRGMDQCSTATLSVVAPSTFPPGACPQTNVVTDDTLGMNFLKLRVSTRGYIGLFGTGFTLGDSLRVRLQLRVTKTGFQVKHPPGSNKRVTFADQIVDCPQSPDAFLVRPNGAVVGRTDLGACLSPNTNLARGNIEIISASVLNAGTGQVVAVPGVLVK